MTICKKEYLDKVLGCWCGKNIGGTFGMPFEWYRQVNSATFYTQELNGAPSPNDDLDIQLLWLMALEYFGTDVNSRQLGHFWSIYIAPHWAEYGVAKANMKTGLMPPFSGEFNNEYKDSCGSYIRSEIWACLAAGDPEKAVEYMQKDSIIDHGYEGEGTYGAMFIVAMQASAFVEPDFCKLIEIGLTFIPSTCATYKAVKLVLDCYAKQLPFLETRKKVLESFRGAPFASMISNQDIADGFGDGRKGFDVPSNIAISVIGLLYCENDFDKAMYITNSCGEDTDCTDATVGAIWGIAKGKSGIPQKWIEPIGNKIITCVLSYGELNGDVPPDINNLTDRVYKLAKQVRATKKFALEIGDEGDVESGINLLASKEMQEKLCVNRGAIFESKLFEVELKYVNSPYFDKNKKIQVEIKITNKFRVSENLSLVWLGENVFNVNPSNKVSLFLARQVYGTNFAKMVFEFDGCDFNNVVNRVALQITVDGKSEIVLIPVVLIKGI